MKVRKLSALALILLLGLLFTVQTVSAHESVTVGDYVVEYGWINEPAIVGQPNAVVINLTLQTASAGADANVDVSTMVIQAAYGGETKVLTLQPLGEDTPGQFIAPITPTQPGVYTIHLAGAVGSTTFNNDVQPEEVKTADVVQFPAATSNQAGGAFGLAGWLGVIGILLGLAGTALGAFSLVRKGK